MHALEQDAFPSEERSSPKYDTVTSLASNPRAALDEDLCERCSANFSVLHPEPNQRSDELSWELGQLPDDLEHSICKFCSFLYRCSIDDGKDRHADYCLEARIVQTGEGDSHDRLSGFELFEKDSPNFRWISVCPPASEQRAERVEGRLSTSEANLCLAKKWLQFCISNHRHECSDYKKGHLSGLFMIDCDTVAIVPHQDGPYVALSYVWGSSSDNNSVSFSSCLPASLPRVIEDAVITTLALGSKYLWVS